MTCFRNARIRLAIVVLLFFPAASVARTRAEQDAQPTAAQAPLEVNGFFEEPAPFAKAIGFAEKRMGEGGEPADGFYLQTGDLISGAGWITLGPGYRHRVWNNRLLIDASAALSWRLYKMARLRAELPELRGQLLAAGAELRWQDNTQVSYFGEGTDAPESNRSQYRVRSTSLSGYVTVRPRPTWAIEGRLGWVSSPSVGAPSGTFIRDFPFTRDVDPLNPVFLRGEQPSYLYGEGSLTRDTRDARGRATQGGIYRAAWSAFSDREGGTSSFGLVHLDAAQFIPLAERRMVLALRAGLVAARTGDEASIPFYLLPSLGGNNTLRGYTDYRFHDRNSLLTVAEMRAAIFTHLDGVVFLDAGSVAPRVGDLDLAKRSYGAGVRVHARGSTLARLDFARSDEGWHVVLRFNDPLRLSRLSRRAPPVPYVP